ncbi:MAG: winged helix-turn-helix transcriptional regulator [Nitrososphaera sp.]
MEDTKARIIAEIGKRPGSRYRELIRATGLANSTFAIHIVELQKLDKIKVQKKNRATRFYPASTPDRECTIFACICQQTAARLIWFMLENDNSSFKEIVKAVGKSPSTISHHLTRLKKNDIVTERYWSTGKTYSIIDKDEISSIIEKYRLLPAQKTWLYFP